MRIEAIWEKKQEYIPVVMVTALDQPSDRVEGLRAGADDFLTKPANDLQLMTLRARNPTCRYKNCRAFEPKPKEDKRLKGWRARPRTDRGLVGILFLKAARGVLSTLYA